MKKIVALSLCIITILICGWLIMENLERLDPEIGNTAYSPQREKQKIDNRTDIDFCVKQVLKTKLECNRENEVTKSVIAVQTTVVALVVIVVQLILLVFIFLMPRKPHL